MTCETVRAQLLERPPSEWSALQPHLDGCADCRALRAELAEGQAELEQALDDFAGAVPFAAALAAIEEPEQPEVGRGGRTMFDGGFHWLITAAAAAAALGLGLYSVRPTAEPPILQAGVETSVCDDLVQLEPDAMLGSLSGERVDCLEKRAGKGDEALAALRLLSVNAWSANDKEAWEAYALELAALTPDDPDLHYKLALHFNRQGPEEAERTIRFAEQALEHRTAWTGETYVNRVFAIYKLRAAAALARWTTSSSERDRQRAAVLAREWHDYAKVSGKETETALRLCLSVADEQFCTGPD